MATTMPARVDTVALDTTGRHRPWIVRPGSSEGVEHFQHTGHGAQQAQQWADLDDGGDQREVAVQLRPQAIRWRRWHRETAVRTRRTLSALRSSHSSFTARFECAG